MFGFIKKWLFTAMVFFRCNARNYVSMKSQGYKVRPEIININSNEPFFYPYRVNIRKCNASCNNINDPYANLCVPDVVKNINIKVFNIISRTNDTRYIKWHETCKCKCTTDASVCNKDGMRINADVNAKN